MDLATTHIGADLDGLAALVALRYLEGPVDLAVPGSMDPPTTHFWKERRDDLPPLLSMPTLRERLASEDLGRLLVVDTARRERLGEIGEHADRFREVRAWDTHDEPESDLPREEMEAAAATVSPLVLEMEARGLRPTEVEAGLFLLGIHADTGHFTFPNTTDADHRAAARCLAWGAPVDWIGRYLPRGLDRHRLALLERMARGVEHVEVQGVPVTILTLELEGHEPDLAVLLDDLRRAEGWHAAFLIASDPSRVAIIGRSDGRLDVAAVLRTLGGGGHPEAASAALHACPLSEARAWLKLAFRQPADHTPTAGEVATETVFSVEAGATIREAADTLHRYRVNALPVTRDQRYVGLVSRREVDDALRHGMEDHPVEAISADAPAWVSPDDDLETARRTMLRTPGRLVLVGHPDEGTRGVLTRSDVFRASASDPPLGDRSTAPDPEDLRERFHRLLGPDVKLVDDLGALAEEMGFRLLLVGGCVRDILLDHPVEDIDLVVEGNAPTLARAAARAMGGRVHVHEAFSTATWTAPGERKVDLVTARTESYDGPAALPRVAPGGLRQDLFRRDFTINAMALDVGPSHAGELIDPFGGQSDLEQGILRVLHGLSFHDDPTRAWRAARFAGRFDFRLAPGTHALLRESLRAGVLERLADQRLGAELHRLFEEREVTRCVALLRDWGLLAPLHPALPGDRELLERITAVREAWVRDQTVAPDDTPDPGEPQWIAFGWNIPRQDRKDMQRLVAGVSGRTRRWVAGPQRVRGVLKTLDDDSPRSLQASLLRDLEPAERVCVLAFGGEAALDAVLWWEREGRLIGPALSGRDLIDQGAKPGPALGEALEAARRVAWDGGDRDAQLRAAQAVLARDSGATDSRPER
ncbi:MAG: CBS domain-containing protein [Myxococcota bacterium]